MRHRGTCRRRVSTALLAGALATACSSGPPGLEEEVLTFVVQSQESDGGRYEPPGRAAREDLVDAVLAVIDGRRDDARRLLERRDYRLAEAAGGSDLVRPVQVPDERGWGLYAVRHRGRPVAVEVPHPRADLRTEHLGVALAERVEASLLLVAGARRDRDDGRADVAHQEDSLFAAVHEALTDRGLPAVQLHGYAQDSSPGNDVVVSAGPSEVGPLVRRAAERLEDAGLRTCRAWREDCGRLEGRTNVQGAASQAAGTPFLHLEVSRRVREDPDARAEVVAAVGAAIVETVPPAPSD